MSLRARYLSASQEPAVRPRLRTARPDLNRDETVALRGPHSVTSLLTLQQTAGNRAVVGALARSRDGAGRDGALGYRSARDLSPLPDKEEEEDITRRRERTTQADPGHRAQGGGATRCGARRSGPGAEVPGSVADPAQRRGERFLQGGLAAQQGGLRRAV
jgi:hypothetical protein